jgi:hypothetical protein
MEGLSDGSKTEELPARDVPAALKKVRIYQQLRPGVEHAKTLKFQRLPGDGSSPFWHYSG